MLNALFGQHFTEPLGLFDGNSTHQNGPFHLSQLFDLFHNCPELFPFGLIDHIRIVCSDHVFVGRDDHYVQIIDLGKLRSFSVGGSGHAGEFFIHAKIVLKSNGGESLIFLLHPHTLLGFQCLVQTITVTTARHKAASKFIHDNDLTIFDHIIHIFGEEGVGLQQLVYHVVAGKLLLILTPNPMFTFCLFLWRE